MGTLDASGHALPVDSDSDRAFATFARVALTLVFAFTAEELLGYEVFSTSLPSHSYVVLCLLQTVACAALVVWGPRVSGRADRTRRWFCPLCAVAGCAVAVAGSTACSVLVELAGFSLLCVASLALKIRCLGVLARMAPRWGGRAVFTGVLFQAFAAPLFTFGGIVAWPLAALCVVAGSVCAGVGGAVPGSYGPRDASPRFSKPFIPVVPVLAGFAVLCVSISYLNPLGLYAHLSTGGFMALGFGTHFAAALLFGLFVFAARDASYTFAFKAMDSLVLVAFILLALLGPQSAVPNALCTTVLSLVEFVTFQAVADLASYTSTDRLRLFGGYYLVLRACALAGMALQAVDASFSGERPFAVVGVLLALAMVVASVWLMTECGLNAFFWGEGLRTPGTPLTQPNGAPSVPGDLRAAVTRRVDAVAHTFDLTPKEREVLGLVAIGRSATFISEELALSSNTVRKRIGQIYAKCGVHSKQELLTLVQSADQPSDQLQ